MAKPAIPPTTPPTSWGTGGALLPPDPAPELDVGEVDVPVALVPPTPLTSKPVPEVAVPDAADADDCESCDDADAESEVGEDVICPEVMPEMLRPVLVAVAKPLGFCDAEAKVAKAFMLLIDASDAEACADKEADMALASELRLVMLIDAEAPEPDIVVADVVKLLLEELRVGDVVGESDVGEDDAATDAGEDEK